MFNTNVNTLEARIHTHDFRIYGMVHVRAHVGMAELLNINNRPYLPVTQSMVYLRGFEHPPSQDEFKSAPEFMAIPKNRIQWVYGGSPSETRGARLESRKLYLMFEDFFVRGEIRMTLRARLSDYLSGAGDKTFQTVYGAEIGTYEPGMALDDIEPTSTHEFVTVNLHNVGAVFDVGKAQDIDMTDFGM
jgi:hypothetical protein